MRTKMTFTQIAAEAVTRYGNTVSRKDLKALCEELGGKMSPEIRKYKVARGLFDLNLFLNGTGSAAVPATDTRTDDDILTDISDRFGAMDRIADGVIDGTFRAMLVSGNPGIGKTYGLELAFESAADAGKIRFTNIKGYVKATGVYKLLWENRDPGCVLMFDDSDSIFQDEVALNLLKGALDTTRRRTINWRSEKAFADECGEAIPNSFDFNGSVVFITNLNFDRLIAQGSRLAPHLEALTSRTYYLDLNLNSTRELILRIESVVASTSILTNFNLSRDARAEVLNFIKDNATRVRELSLRMVLKLGTIRKASKNHADFNRMAMATCIRRG